MPAFDAGRSICIQTSGPSQNRRHCCKRCQQPDR